MFNDTFEQGYQFAQIKNEIVQADNLVNVYPYNKAAHEYILFSEIKRVILKILKKYSIIYRYNSSFFSQFYWLFWRQIRSDLRNPIATHVLLAQSVVSQNEIKYQSMC